VKHSYGHDKEILSVDPFVSRIPAQFIRIGKQILTEDGWQTTRGLVVFADPDQVSVFTDERNDIESDGWQFHFDEPVLTRLEPTEEHERARKFRQQSLQRQAEKQRAEAERQERLAQLERERQELLAKAAAGCPSWCVEHYDGGTGDERVRNHSSEPKSVVGADVHTGAPAELSFWLERRNSCQSGAAETVIVVETRPHADDIELSPHLVHQLAARLQSLGHRAELHR
jgi:hypothetical protein